MINLIIYVIRTIETPSTSRPTSSWAWIAVLVLAHVEITIDNAWSMYGGVRGPDTSQKLA